MNRYQMRTAWPPQDARPRTAIDRIYEALRRVSAEDDDERINRVRLRLFGTLPEDKVIGASGAETATFASSPV